MLKQTIKLEKSKLFAGMIGATVILNWFIIFNLSIPPSLKIILSIFVALYGFYIIYRYVLLKHKNSITKISLDSRGWHFATKHQTFQVEISGQSTLTRWVLIICFRVPSQRFTQSCVIFNDSIPAEDFRRLFVLLKVIKR